MLASCVVSNRITEFHHLRGNMNGLKLRQDYTAQSAVENGSSVLCTVSATYLFEEKKNLRPEITVALNIASGLSAGKPDSVVYFDLDNEKIRIVSNQPLTQAIKIPENLWVSMVHSQKIIYSLNIGTKGLDIGMTPSQTNTLKEFLLLAIRRRDAQFPAIPQGKVKW